ncbi:MAG: MarR family winged helix-turn-helix transcriptional regulator, partial [Candidatus Thorarchaeota archaeon]
SITAAFEKHQNISFKEHIFHSSEILIIITLKHHTRNLTKLAEKLQITKGAASQTISRLERKGIVNKNPNSNNKNELNFTFTPDGEKLIEIIANFHNTLEKKVMEHLQVYSKDEKATISNFLDNIEMILSE